MAIGKQYSVETKVGKVNLIPNSGTVLYVSLGDKDSQITVFGVGYTGSLRLEVTNGLVTLMKSKSDPTGFNSLSLDGRWTGNKWIESSHAADNKVKAVVIPAIQAYVTAHPEILVEAAALDLADQIQRQQEVVVKLKTHYDAALVELNRLNSLVTA